MSEGCFRVYRLAEAPQEYVDFARLGRDDDPIVVIEKGANEQLHDYASWMAAAGADLARTIMMPAPDGVGLKRHESPTHIIYTVDRG